MAVSRLSGSPITTGPFYEGQHLELVATPNVPFDATDMAVQFNVGGSNRSGLEPYPDGITPANGRVPVAAGDPEAILDVLVQGAVGRAEWNAFDEGHPSVHTAFIRYSTKGVRFDDLPQAAQRMPALHNDPYVPVDNDGICVPITVTLTDSAGGALVATNPDFPFTAIIERTGFMLDSSAINNGWGDIRVFDQDKNEMFPVDGAPLLYDNTGAAGPVKFYVVPNSTVGSISQFKVTLGADNETLLSLYIIDTSINTEPDADLVAPYVVGEFGGSYRIGSHPTVSIGISHSNTSGALKDGDMVLLVFNGHMPLNTSSQFLTYNGPGVYFNFPVAQLNHAAQVGPASKNTVQYFAYRPNDNSSALSSIHQFYAITGRTIPGNQPPSPTSTMPAPTLPIDPDGSLLNSGQLQSGLDVQLDWDAHWTPSPTATKLKAALYLNGWDGKGSPKMGTPVKEIPFVPGTTTSPQTIHFDPTDLWGYSTNPADESYSNMQVQCYLTDDTGDINNALETGLVLGPIEFNTLPVG